MHIVQNILHDVKQSKNEGFYSTTVLEKTNMARDYTEEGEKSTIYIYIYKCLTI